MSRRPLPHHFSPTACLLGALCFSTTACGDAAPADSQAVVAMNAPAAMPGPTVGEAAGNASGAEPGQSAPAPVMTEAPAGVVEEPAAAPAVEPEPSASDPGGSGMAPEQVQPHEPATPEPQPATPEPQPATPATPATPEPEPQPATPEPEPQPATPEPEPQPATPEPQPATPEPAVPEPQPATPEPEPLPNFSFFVTSLEGLQRLSGSQDGFGGDLRYGEATGLEGADKICTELAEHSMPGASAKQWRAFLSVANGPDGGPVHAIERIGEGPWFDRVGRTVALSTEDLISIRPRNADPQIINDLPNEYGVPNQRPDPTQGELDNHHIMTGTGLDGRLYEGGTCGDWMRATADAGQPRCGFSWPRNNNGSAGKHWMTTHNEAGCTPGIELRQRGGAPRGSTSVGAGGGYGGIYCFSLSP